MTDRPTLEQVKARSAKNRAAWRDTPHSGRVRVAKPARKPQESTPSKPASRKTGRSIPPKPSEHQIQIAVVTWWDIWSKSKGLDYRLLHSVPNAGAGGSKGQAGKMKAEGARAGYPDLVLDLALMSGQSLVFHGARFELKAWKGRTSPEQRSYHDLLIKQNYMVLVVYGYDEAVRAITEYVARALR